MRPSTPARRLLTLAAIAPALACGSAPDGGDAARPLDEPRTMIVETAPLRIDRIYRSMAGPDDRLTVDPADLDWVVAYDTEVRDALDGEPMGDEFFCHSQLQMENTTRLLVTATGAEEIRFPEGFAMPVSRILAARADEGAPVEELTFLGMVLNNHRPDIDRLARVRATIEYFRDEDFGDRPRPRKLFKVGLPMAVEDLEAYDAPHEAMDDDVATHCVLVGGLNGHWMVPPGEQITRRRFEGIVPVESTVHYGVVHLHNYADYLRLTDVTTGEVLFQADVEYEPERVQIERIPVYESATGFTLHPDHVYEIEARYTNTTDADVDAMALIDLYYNPVDDRDVAYEAPEV